MLTKLQEVGLRAILPQISQIDAMNCAIEFEREYDVRLDWHEFSAILDRFSRQGILEQAGFTAGRMVVYRLPRPAGAQPDPVYGLKLAPHTPMDMDPADRPSYDEWVQRVDEILIKFRGISLYDLPDCTLRDWYDARLRPVRAADQALRNAYAGE